MKPFDDHCRDDRAVTLSRLDSFLELKIENERLRRRLVDLRPSASSYPPPPYLSGAAVSNVRGGGADVVFPADSLHAIALNVNPGSLYASNGLSVPRAYQAHYFAGPPLKTSAPISVAPEEISPVNDRFTTSYRSESSTPSGIGRSRARDAVDDTEGSGNDSAAPRKKKARKIAAGAPAGDDVMSGSTSNAGSSGATASSKHGGAAPQYVCVTCGRTDSPEWRKGPLGAKTLCNACGLRWAKRNQKKKAESAAATTTPERESSTNAAAASSTQEKDAEEPPATTADKA
jgi:hypothetical protein